MRSRVSVGGPRTVGKVVEEGKKASGAFKGSTAKPRREKGLPGTTQKITLFQRGSRQKGGVHMIGCRKTPNPSTHGCTLGSHEAWQGKEKDRLCTMSSAKITHQKRARAEGKDVRQCETRKQGHRNFPARTFCAKNEKKETMPLA